MTDEKTLWDLPDDMLLTGKEVEAATNKTLKLHKLVRARAEGWGPEFIKVGSGLNGRVAYRVGAVREWLESRAVKNTAQIKNIMERDQKAMRRKAERDATGS